MLFLAITSINSLFEERYPVINDLLLGVLLNRFKIEGLVALLYFKSEETPFVGDLAGFSVKIKELLYGSFGPADF
jgi:hypothetical protein